MEQLLSAIPLIFVAILVTAVGFFIARAIKGLVESFLAGVGFDGLPERMNLAFLVPKSGARLSNIAGSAVMAIILLLTAQQALQTLELDSLSAMVGGLLGYLPQLLAGVVIILAALSLGTYVSGLIAQVMGGTPQGRLPRVLRSTRSTSSVSAWVLTSWVSRKRSFRSQSLQSWVEPPWPWPWHLALVAGTAPSRFLRSTPPPKRVSHR